MKATNYISKKEHKLLLIVAFAAMTFILSSFTLEMIGNYNYSVVEEQQKLEKLANGYPTGSFPIYNDYSPIAGLHLLTVFIFAALIKPKRYLLPFFLTVFYADSLIYSLSYRFNTKPLGGEGFSPHVNVSFFKKIYLEANNFDYFAAFFILILLIWQISILFRIFNKTRQNKTVFP